MDSLFAKVAVEQTLYSFDQAFTYAVPAHLSAAVLPGCRVLVPFGKGNKTRIGMVLETLPESDTNKCKLIAAVLDAAPLLYQEQLQLAVYLSRQTFCTLYDALRAMLPPGINQRLVFAYSALPAPQDAPQLCAQEEQIYSYLLEHGGYHKQEAVCRKLGFNADVPYFEILRKKGYLSVNTDVRQGVQDATRRMVRLCDESEAAALPKLTQKQTEIIKVLRDVGCASVREVCYFTGFTPAVVLALEKKGIVTVYDITHPRSPGIRYEQSAEQNPIVLTKEQENCFQGLYNQYNLGGGTALLFGVTGSGKTQVYLRLLDAVLEQDKGAIVMVPEIALTPQMLALFYSRYGKKVAVFHSGLSAGERADEWRRVKNGEAQIALGTRSAVFAPLKAIGLIILDEEQEHTYKSEQAPRYATKDVARFRASYHKALVLLASATPSVESFAAAQNGNYSLYTLRQRYGEAILPEVVTVDMKEEAGITAQSPVFSRYLLDKLREALAQKRQAILLINRRGYHTFCVCRSCSHVISCPYCSISMTYHTANNRLMCHYCGYTRPFSSVCDVCQSPDVRYSGYGTQRIETELAEALPEARILRMDMDTTSGRYAHETKLEQFRQKEFDILLGTQMVAKGLDFENVTLVGVISVDQQLYNDDYRSLEQTFSLLTQVVGRAGRGQYPGEAVLQTETPENPIIRFAARQDYEAFYKTEIRIRKMMTYPPYCDICVLGFACEEEGKAKAASKLALELLTRYNTEEYSHLKLIVLGPLPARIAKVSNKYRFRLLIKCRANQSLREMVAHILKEIGAIPAFGSVNVWADINPKDS